MNNVKFKTKRQYLDFEKIYLNIYFKDSEVRQAFDGTIIIDISDSDCILDIEAFISNLHNKNIIYNKKHNAIIIL